TSSKRDWSSDVCSSDLRGGEGGHGGLPAPGAELAGEFQEGTGGRAAPTVDRLVRVPHGGRGVAAARAEQRGEELHLRDRGVLIFVEQAHVVGRPFGLPPPRPACGEIGRDAR